MDGHTKLCAQCANLSITTALEKLALDHESSITLDSLWHESLFAVNESATKCLLCALAMKGWRQSRGLSIEETRASGDFDIDNPPEDLFLDILEIDAFRVITSCNIDVELGRQSRHAPAGVDIRDFFYLRLTCKVQGTISSWDAHDDLVADFRVAIDSETDAATADIQSLDTSSRANSLPMIDQLVALDPTSNRAIYIARAWLQSCVRTHGSSCRAPHLPGTPSWRDMPTRILEVPQEGSKIYLRISKDVGSGSGDYIALSHCWGNNKFITTRANLQERMAGIDIDDLPQTFKDAVAVTKNLGLRYLWIDSLCIIQKDLEDWQKESAEMSNVYRDAYLVLGATSGNSDSDGFLGPRIIDDMVRVCETARISVSLQLLPPEGNERGLRWASKSGRGPDPLANEPLTGRSWCLQERYLAMRSLQYGSHQMFWDCTRMRASEDGDFVDKDGGFIESLCLTSKTTASVFNRKDSSPATEDIDVKWLDWYRMVEEYSTRRITMATDKLPALSGLAQELARKTGQTGYMAGLWRTGLIEGLIWTSSNVGGVLSEASEYIAPSWSWASVQGKVEFPIYTWHRVRAHWVALIANFEPLTRYENFAFELKDKDTYGRLTHASLTIQGPLVPVISMAPRPLVTPENDFIWGMKPYRSSSTDMVLELQLGPDQRIWIDGGFDRISDERDHNLVVVFLTRLPLLVDSAFYDHRFGLLLQQTENGDYQRVGFVDGCILETYQSAISRLRRQVSKTTQAQKDNKNNLHEVSVQHSIVERFARLDELEQESIRNGTARKLTIAAFQQLEPFKRDEEDANSLNSIAPDPIKLIDSKLTLI